MLIKNTVYLIKSDEGKYIVLHIEPTNQPISIEDREDNPLEFYHIDGRKVSIQLMALGHIFGHKQIVKVFQNYPDAIKYLSEIGIMNETNST